MKDDSYLITFEGGEGSGKSTLISKLEEFLSDKGNNVAVGREPGTTEGSEAIREVILDPNLELNDKTEFYLFEAARSQFTEDFVKPSLRENDYVLIDRFYDSTTTYQGYGSGLNLDIIKDNNEYAADNITPDLTFFLDVNPEKGLERASENEFDGKDSMEEQGLDFHERVRQGYLTLADNNPDRFTVINTSDNDEQEVYNIALESLDKRDII